MSNDYWRKPEKPVKGRTAVSADVFARPDSSMDDTATRPAVSDLAAKSAPVGKRVAATKGATRAERSGAKVAAPAVAAASAAAATVSMAAVGREADTAATTTAATKAATPARVSAAANAARRTRKARLRLSRIDPWSVMKTSLLFAIAGGFIFFTAVWVLWGVISASGMIESINKTVNDLLATPGAAQNFDLGTYLNTNKILGLAAIIAAADVVIFTALATLFSFLYNLSATVMGGLEVTLAED